MQSVFLPIHDERNICKREQARVRRVKTRELTRKTDPTKDALESTSKKKKYKLTVKTHAIRSSACKHTHGDRQRPIDG